MADWDPRNREILHSAQGVDTPISVRRHVTLTEKIVLPPGGDAGEFERTRCRHRDRIGCLGG
jgi:hypothetical protein